jgi:formate-dependent nitrite reductase membrane component NrfD
MHELEITRHNHQIDPTLAIWGWEIPVYLFLGGLVAGMMIISGYFLYRGRHTEMHCSCLRLPLAAIAALSAGMLALFIDLEHRWYFWRMYVTFQPGSPMSWGSWILLLVYPAIFANMLVRVPAPLLKMAPWLGRWSAALYVRPQTIRTVGISNMVLGAALGIYTGILLSAFGARPLWNSAILGLLFLASGLSTAAALVHMTSRDRDESLLLARADNAFLSVELVLIALFLIGLITSTEVHIRAAQLLLSGPFAPAFWVFVVGMGIVVPLGLQSLAVRHRIAHSPVPPLMVIAGGLILRFVLVGAGQASHWLR